MSRYVLDHHLEGEKKRLALMSSLLDPLHRRHIESLGISREARVLEVGCGNGSMSAWMAKHIAPDGQIVALDLDLSLVDNVRAPGVEFRQGDILTGPVDPGRFDFVTARAVLHHVADARAAIGNLVASLRPGGAILLIEPDFLPVSVAEPTGDTDILEWMVSLVARAGHRLSYRSNPGAAARCLWSQGNCRHRGDGDL